MGRTLLLLFPVMVLYSISAADYPEIRWWCDLDAPSFGSAAIDDIDGDGRPEVVFGCYFGDERIYALNGEDGSELWSFDTGGCNDASPVIYDVDLDGDPEVIMPASSPYRVYCLSGDSGHVEWSTSTGYPNCIDSPPAVADLDGDDRPEVVLGTFYGWVFCLNGEDGGIFWSCSLGTDSYIQSAPCILDVEGDGDLDVVVAQYLGDNRIYALEGYDGSILWHNDEPTQKMYHGGSFADVDGDGRPEIAIGCWDGRVFLLNAEDGSTEWTYQTPAYIGAPTSIADLDGDGGLETVYSSGSNIGVLDEQGSYLWGYPLGGGCFRGAALANIDGDTVVDVIFGDDSGVLTALTGTAPDPIWTIDLEAHYGSTFQIDHAPTVADLDGDGKLDVFVVGGYGTSSPPPPSHGRAYMLSAGEGTGPGWPMFRHDRLHSAYFDRDGTGGPGGAAPGPAEPVCFPNPSTAAVTLRMEVPEARVPVLLEVLDLSGRTVRLLEGEAGGGTAEVTWDGRDGGGSPVPPGCYLYRMECGGSVSVGRLLRI